MPQQLELQQLLLRATKTNFVATTTLSPPLAATLCIITRTHTQLHPVSTITETAVDCL